MQFEEGPVAGTLHEQLERRLRDQIRGGLLPAGSTLPSTRSLAQELGISRGVVSEAYSQLAAEGYLVSSQGAPTRVAAVAGAERPPLPASTLEARHAYDFSPYVPDLSAFPRRLWLRSLRSVLQDAPFGVFAAGDPRGSADLRNTLMSYLARVRGAAAEPEHTIICAGFAQGLAVLCRSLRDRGVERLAVEDPGWAPHRLIAQQSGMELVGVRVDEEGVDVGRLSEAGCEAIVLTPAHQFPTGVVLSSERRAALLEWAEDRDGLIVEDDYDSELRYDRSAVGCLQGLAPERVCQIGSFGLRLAPGLRLGWVLSPSWLTGALTYEKGLADGGCPIIEQLALADFIGRGELDRHLRRMRLRYRARRESLSAALAAELPGWALTGIPAGTFALALGPAGRDLPELVRRAADRGVGVEEVDGPRPALVLGFANQGQPAIRRGVARLGEALRASSS